MTTVEILTGKIGAVMPPIDVSAMMVDIFKKWEEYEKELDLAFTGYDEHGYARLEIGGKEMATSPFRKGRVLSHRSAGGTGFLSLKDGESAVFVPLVGLDEMLHADMHEYWDIRPAIYHPCISRNCPGCDAGNEPRFKGYMPVQRKDGEIMVFPFTVSVYNQLEELEDGLEEIDDGNLRGYAVKFSRRGSGMSTRYTITGLGKRINVDEIEVPDFVAQLGPQDKEGITELLESRGVVTSEAGTVIKTDDYSTTEDIVEDIAEGIVTEDETEATDGWDEI